MRSSSSETNAQLHHREQVPFLHPRPGVGAVVALGVDGVLVGSVDARQVLEEADQGQDEAARDELRCDGEGGERGRAIELENGQRTTDNGSMARQRGSGPTCMPLKSRMYLTSWNSSGGHGRIMRKSMTAPYTTRTP